MSVGEKTAALDDDDEQRRQVPAVGVVLERLDQRAGHGVAGDHHGVDLLGARSVDHTASASNAGHEHDGVALEQEPQRAPLGGAVHERRDVEA